MPKAWRVGTEGCQSCYLERLGGWTSGPCRSEPLDPSFRSPNVTQPKVHVWFATRFFGYNSCYLPSYLIPVIDDTWVVSNVCECNVVVVVVIVVIKQETTKTRCTKSSIPDISVLCPFLLIVSALSSGDNS